MSPLRFQLNGKVKENIALALVLAILIEISSILIRGFVTVYRTFRGWGLGSGIHQFDEDNLGTTGFYIMILLSLIVIIALRFDLNKYYNKIRKTYIVVAFVISVFILLAYLSYGPASKIFGGYAVEAVLIGYIALLFSFTPNDWYQKIFKRMGIILIFVSIVSFLGVWGFHAVNTGETTIFRKKYIDYGLSLLYGGVITYSSYQKNERLISFLVMLQIFLALLILYEGRSFL